MEKDATNEVITKLISWIESSAEFVKDEAPDFIAQYMKAAFIKTWFDISILIIAVIAFSLITYFCIKSINSYEKSYEAPVFYCMFQFLAPFAAIVCFIGLIEEVHNLINLYVAPKCYILCNLKKFLK